MDISYEEFIELHRAQLQACGLPQQLWRTAFEKLIEEKFDAGEYLQVVYVAVEDEDEDEDEEDAGAASGEGAEASVAAKSEERLSGYRVRASRPIDRHSNVFLIDHAWSTSWGEARKQLREIPGLVERLLTMFDVAVGEEEVAALRAQPPEEYRAPEHLVSRGELAAEPTWYVMDEVGSWMRHRTAAPSFALVPSGAPRPAPRPRPRTPRPRLRSYVPRGVFYSLAWPLADVAEGDEATRDYQPGAAPPRPCHREALAGAFATMASAKEAGAPRPARGPRAACAGRAPRRGHGAERGRAAGEALERLRITSRATVAGLAPGPARRPLRILTDLAVVRESVRRPEFELVDDEAQADVLWLSANITDWRTVPPRLLVSQFPGEGCLVEKHRLAALCQGRFGRPRWLPRTLDLEKEAPDLIALFVLRQEEGFDNHWIVKPVRLARSMDTCVSSHLAAILRLAETGPKVVSKYIEKPALLDGCKFDLRFIVLLRSTAPLVLYAYTRFWIRCANEPYELRELEQYERHFTVMNYTAGPMKQVRMEEFVARFEAQGGGPWGATLDAIHAMLRQPFLAAADTMPHYPQGRAMYGVDVMLDAGREPYLLEVTYMPDCTRAEKFYPGFHDSALAALLLDQPDPADWRPI
eukprot:tig00000692_g3246.t1